MALYSALIPEIEAIQWFKNGDHPDDHVIRNINTGRVVRRYNGDEGLCPTCNRLMSLHGVIVKPTLPTENIVCPGDYIQPIRNTKGFTLNYKLWKQLQFESQFIKQEV